ncbi:reverse transcriptase [Trifolium pratense]|uniref:Reverse transcriptase n=1 Tax=Trifolium pratense TaxID=57577 RepID=A0A2K3PN30_TRIPR|nr:reverse transcriptase [Trifolium pratense]
MCDGVPVARYIRSSVWPGIKPHIATVNQQTRWFIGSGDNILFWSDNWLGNYLIELLHIPQSLQGTVRSFTHNNNSWRVPHCIVDKDPASSFTHNNNSWRVPHCIVDKDPAVAQLINKTILPTTALT